MGRGTLTRRLAEVEGCAADVVVARVVELLDESVGDVVEVGRCKQQHQ